MIRQTNTKKFGLELDQKLKHLMVEKNCFIKIMIELELILMIIYLEQTTKISKTNNNYQIRSSRGWKIVSTNLFRGVFFWVVKMPQYNRIDVSEGIDSNKTIESKEYMLCHYWYFDHIIGIVIMLWQWWFIN